MLCKTVWSIQIKVKALSSWDRTHEEGRSLKTPAGRWPHLLSGPGSVASETGSGNPWRYGQERWYPPSSLGHWWPQDATLRPLESPGERWKPTKVHRPDQFELIRDIIFSTGSPLHRYDNMRSQCSLPESHRKYRR